MGHTCTFYTLTKGNRDLDKRAPLKKEKVRLGKKVTLGIKRSLLEMVTLGKRVTLGKMGHFLKAGSNL